ncbi:MAG: geranylgeranylglyceryl/heptaprenylglyceryl phosphate synthase [Candidatus Stahlbacteria bacterium]|nr:geranylgeranylglyceryl/heptaprenylglyceryl phosphate synthase [Candidatus Stahlbacteria bacterium]
MKTYFYLTHLFNTLGAAFLALIDPDKCDKVETQVKYMSTNGVDAILVGGSTIGSDNFNDFMKRVKSVSTVPVIIFPSSAMQVSAHADAILFLSLISGNNPQYLISEHIRASPMIKNMGLETIPTGYLLIESGNITSVAFMSHTMPIPRDKIDIAKYNALAGEYLGMKFIYLEAGSGAKHSVPTEMIKAINKYISIPIIVGGGIRTPDDAHSKVEAGAKIIVIGNVLQKKVELTKEFANAIHIVGKVSKP